MLILVVRKFVKLTELLHKTKSKKDIVKGTVFKSTIQCPLSCNICPKTFRDPSGLYKHVKTHEKTEQIKMLQTSDSVIIDI